MPSLTQLLRSHRQLLVLDAASSRVQVGLLRAGSDPIWHAAEADAGTEIFRGVTIVLERAGLEIGSIAATVFGEGPGSLLGIRTAAMALRTWSGLSARPTFAFQSLAVAGTHEWRRQPPRDFSVLADARRGCWHCQTVGADGRLEPLRRLPEADLPTGEWVMPEQFRTWTPPPRPMGRCSYDLATIFAAIADCDRFHAVDAAEPFQPGPTDYRKWTAGVHSLDSVERK